MRLCCPHGRVIRCRWECAGLCRGRLRPGALLLGPRFPFVSSRLASKYLSELYCKPNGTTGAEFTLPACSSLACHPCDPRRHLHYHSQVELRQGDMSWGTFLEAAAAPSEIAAHMAGAEDLTNIIFSSGTTGKARFIYGWI